MFNTNKIKDLEKRVTRLEIEATPPKTLYKFFNAGLTNEHGNVEWNIGKWHIEEKAKLCKSGFHASSTPLQALSYVKGEIIAEVEVRGQSDISEDKECWTKMRIVKAYNWTKKDSVELAVFAAEQVIGIYEDKYPDDKRPRKAIEAAKKFLKTGKASANAANAAYAAANAAAYAANAAYAAAYAANAAYAAAYAANAAANVANAAYAAANAANAAAYAANAAYAAYRSSLVKNITPILNEWFINKIKTLTVYEK